MFTVRGTNDLRHKSSKDERLRNVFKFLIVKVLNKKYFCYKQNSSIIATKQQTKQKLKTVKFQL